VALNEIFKEGNHLSFAVPDGTLAGKPLRIGILNVVAETDEGGATVVVNGITQATGGVGNKDNYTSTSQVGVWELDVTGTLTVGQAVYIKSDNTLTATSTGNWLFGAAIRAKGSGTGPAFVKVLQPGQVTASA
jgi:Uncharacterized conserved protein (DUF2190)